MDDDNVKTEGGAGKEDEIIVSTSGLNRYKFRVMTSGLDWSEFDTNPLMLYNHIRVTDSYDRRGDLMFPLGRWEDRRIDGDKVYMRPVFNTATDAGKLAQESYRNKFLNTGSVHLDVIEWSEDPNLLLPGQTRATVTRAKVLETSLTDLPGNAGCYKLSFQGGDVVSLSLSSSEAEEDALNAVVPKLKLAADPPKTTLNNNMDELKLVARAIDESLADTDVNVITLVSRITTLKSRAEAAEAELAKLSATTATQRKKALVDENIRAGKITEADRDLYEGLADKDYDNTKLALERMKAYVVPTTQLKAGDGDNANLVERYIELDKAGKLGTLSEDERSLLVLAYTNHLRATGKVK